uniref:Nicotinate-nucleotide pyrophosphorylase [carboxylating] n=1 Tax=Chlamydomonas leiostraca TaxID=1034604 RepID=A0A7S0WZN1_9CHLO|mmetsp:Transcript_4905/g.12022  ORF Transcript_4905/g.12022 Transcript_4905/m.12022 type:complete len:323 (+) Transcript_4905:136-1104(+)|eukprot:CAMPEP_0202862202 /NCGR_PEP_ID=MMETSP1391-20130828/3332_1 /ASSEMBLY_ACC=CAM_ASM_000867 /TAXON_ID=1034604 /ORGANISM="Chlamydomonas leiostraca, Strain SAG 11-49" /LENGTH=322 /DNA_ID=CAMNT_0049541707 /DNA_START=131 /DNA_END=1099 /DNA_ORIENTATION=-
MTKTHTPIPPPPHPTYDIHKVIKEALEEDAGGIGDVTTLATVPPGTRATGTFLAKSAGVLAGLGVADAVFAAVDPAITVAWEGCDGEVVGAGHVFGRVCGPAASILVAERVALNFMQRMSGIATATRAMVAAATAGGHSPKILETRKTAPGLRLLDKWAVLIGGGHNHRMGLYDMMMIKDNHVTAAGGVTQAIARAEAYIRDQGLQQQGMRIEVETRTLAEVDEVVAALDAGQAPHVTRVMLDNMTKHDPSQPGGLDVSLLSEAVARLGGRVESEASGNVVVETVGAFAAAGVTHISVGALTHSVRAMDISLKIALEHWTGA